MLFYVSHYLFYLLVVRFDRIPLKL